MNNANLSGKNRDLEYLFITLTYNHELYIVEHLESIRYQIEHWGDGRRCSILIADDCSRDATVSIAKAWLKVHGGCFESFEIIESDTNGGTCANFVRVFPYSRGKRIKVLAGDDLYSSLSIFELIDRASADLLVSGLPLMLYPEGLYYSKAQAFNIIASEEIYSKNFLGAMKAFCAIHTPSLAYDSSVFDIPGMTKFISSFLVVEDFAMQIRLAEAKPNLRYDLNDQFYIYYRRTRQSTYIIRNSAFNNDKKRLYRHLAEKERNPIRRSLIRNRILCLNMNGIKKYIFNANTLVYAMKIVMKLPNIMRRLSMIKADLNFHSQHLHYLNDRSKVFIDSYIG